MSLIPACTAESAMNSAFERAAMSRASVVLPVPGGPQRISECGWPEAIASYSGLPGASRWDCPTNSSSVRGRMRSARGCQSRLLSSPSGRCIELRRTTRSRYHERLKRSVATACAGSMRRLAGSARRRADDIGARRYREMKRSRIHGCIAPTVGEIHLHGLAEHVAHDHASELGAAKTEARLAEIGLWLAWAHQYPLQTRLCRLRGDVELLAQRRGGTRQQHDRRRRQGCI